MDTFENNTPQQEEIRSSEKQFAPQEPVVSQEPVPVQEEARPEPQKPRQRVSPYADSPYEVQHRQPEPYRYVPRNEPAEKPVKKKNPGLFGKIVAAVAAVAVLVTCGVTVATVNTQLNYSRNRINQLNQKVQQLEQQLEQQEVPEDNRDPVADAVSSSGSMTPAQVYAANVDSVVAISVTVQGFEYGQVMEGTSSGSGFILTEDGYVVTNYHVVEGATAISVVMHDDTSYPATLVGQDSTNDVAVLKVDAQGLPAARLGSSSALNVGDMVVAIGNPLGELNATQTVGYIGGKDREVTTGGTIINMLQTDAAINPGNSGGPLFNMDGQVVGITTAKYSGTTNSGASIEGIGFAIPIDDVLGIIGDLQNFGYVTGPYLGVTVQNLSEEVMEVTGIRGVHVLTVEPGYCAEKAGLQPGDIIVALDSKPTTSITDLTRTLRDYEPGDEVTIVVIREGERLELTGILDEKPQTLNQPENTMPLPEEGNYEDWYDYFFGQD